MDEEDTNENGNQICPTIRSNRTAIITALMTKNRKQGKKRKVESQTRTHKEEEELKAQETQDRVDDMEVRMKKLEIRARDNHDKDTPERNAT